MISEQSIKRNQNRSAILNAIQENGPLKRMEFSEVCGIRKSSITSIIDELVEKDLLCNIDIDKPRSPLRFTEGKYFVASVAIAVNKVVCALVDLSGGVYHRSVLDYDVSTTSSQDLLEIVGNGLDKLLSKQPERILGIGVAMPGIVDSEAGICKHVINVPQLQDAGLKTYLEKRFTQRIYVENDVRASLWSSVWFDQSLGKKGDILYLEVGDGISTALLVNGVRHRGANSSAGEVGHLNAGDEKRICRCGKVDCLETYSSVRAILSEIKQFLPQNDISSAADIGNNGENQIIVNVLDRAMEKLTAILAPLVAYIDPQQILLGNQNREFYEVLLPAFEKHLRSNLQGCASQNVDIQIAPATEDCALRGIAGVAISEAFTDILAFADPE